MKRRPLDFVAPGMFVARPIVDEAGRVLLNAGVALTDRYLTTLAEKGFHYLYVRDVAPPPNDDSVPQPVPDEHVAAAEAVARAYSAVHRELGGAEPRTLLEHAKWCKARAAEELAEAGGPIKAVAAAADGLLVALERAADPGPLAQRARAQSMAEHAVRVAEHCYRLGEFAGLGTRPMHALTVGALLHDIGKAFAVGEDKPNASIVYHTTLGFELLRACIPENRLAQHVAYEHHEFQDGSGLPRGLVGGNRIERNRNLRPPIPTLVGEIAAIANDYDRLVQGALSDPLPPDMALNVLRGHAGSRYNAELVRRFTRAVTPYPPGEDVAVESGQYEGCTAVVWEVDPLNTSRPVVTVYLDQAGLPCEPVAIDLRIESGVTVRGLGFG